MQYDAVIFDLDDTLLQTVKVKWAQHRAVAKQFYDVDLTDDILHEHWGKPFDKMVGLLYGHPDTLENMITAVRSTDAEFRKGVFADAVSTTETLFASGASVGIVTSTFREWALLDLAMHGFRIDEFAFVNGSLESAFHKPDPRVFDAPLAYLHEAGCAERVVYVGDGLIDHAAASGAGLDFIGVTTGLIDSDTFLAAGVEHIVASVSDVLPLILD